MKKLLAILMAAIFVVGMVSACGSSSTTTTAAPADTQAATEAATEAVTDASTGTDIVLLIPAGETVDDHGFCEASYNGIKQFCEETGHTYDYMMPKEDTEDGIYEIIDAAVLAGAKVIVASGATYIGYMEAIFETYPDIYFICNEIPMTNAAANSVVNNFRSQEGTFLAGAACVYEGYTTLGHIGGSQIIPNMNGGYGFIQGVNWAAKELGVDVTLKYWYCNEFVASPDTQAYAASWYQNGVQVINAYCGGAANSVYAAAEANNGAVVAPDTDQSSISETIITCALKNLAPVTYNDLLLWEAGEFPGGENASVGLEDDAVGLSMDTSKFKKFTADDYAKICEKITSGEITVLDASEIDNAETFYKSLSEQNITFEYFE